MHPLLATRGTYHGIVTPPLAVLQLFIAPITFEIDLVAGSFLQFFWLWHGYFVGLWLCVVSINFGERSKTKTSNSAPLSIKNIDQSISCLWPATFAPPWALPLLFPLPRMGFSTRALFPPHQHRPPPSFNWRNTQLGRCGRSGVLGTTRTSKRPKHGATNV